MDTENAKSAAIEPTHIIVATVESILENRIKVKGVSPYLFQDSKKKQWNIFESLEGNDPLLLPVEEKGLLNCASGFISVVTSAFIEKKTLKMAVSLDKTNQFSLVSISRNEN